MNKAFSHFDFCNGFIGELDRKFPSYLSAWTSEIDLNGCDTHYAYCYEGEASIEYKGVTFPFPAGYYACIPGSAVIKDGAGIVMSREGYDGMFSLGGEIEHAGRLKYIDGCTDSLLIAPVKLGDPCLNLLYFPKDIDQTAHTHPSDRIGMILSGEGRCHAWNDGVEEIIELKAGMIFCIHAEGLHKFSTPHGSELRVLAYHPDSDYGPTDQFHPMLNRTMVDGVSANQLDDIRTK